MMKKKKKKMLLDLALKHCANPSQPACRHFGECGGCMFQDIPYESQCSLKIDYLNTILDEIHPVTTIIPSHPLRYRNRMDYVTAFGKIGLRQAGRYRHVVDIESCEILQERANTLLKQARSLLPAVEGYDYLTHSGYLRYCVIRQARFTGQVMVNFVVAHPENRLSDSIEPIVEAADSVSILLSDGMADLSFGPVLETVRLGYIEETFDGIRYRITPNSFFQSNSEIALALYRAIRDEVDGERVLDLYSGVGSIGLYVASRAKHVTGVEILGEAVSCAEENRRLNSIENVSFLCGDSLQYLKESGETYDTVIIDPPRAGIHPKAAGALNQCGAATIIYVSCNPTALRNDLIALDNYAIRSLEAYDMFPQTPHVETLAILKRKQLS